MSFPNIPDDISPIINIPRDKVINLLLASIAFEELGLAHVINAGAEEVQSVLGTLDGQRVKDPSADELQRIDKAVEQILRHVIMKEMLLQFKLENILRLDGGRTARFMYVTNIGDSTVQIYDITNAVSPVHVGEFGQGDLSAPCGLAIKGNTLYVANAGGN